MSTFDLEQLKQEIYQTLIKTSHRHHLWFAVRLGLRGLPLLSIEGLRFSFWQEHREQHLLSVFCALNALITRIFSDLDSTAAANAYAYATLAFSESNAYHAFAFASAFTAVIDEKANSTQAVVDVAAALANLQFSQPSGKPTINRQGLAAVLYKETKLVQHIQPQHHWPVIDDFPQWLDGEHTAHKILGQFEDDLKAVGFGYFVHQYQNWLRGHFDLDASKRLLLIDESLIADDPFAVITLLDHAEQA